MVGYLRFNRSPGSASPGAAKRELGSAIQDPWLKSLSEWEKSILLESDSPAPAGNFPLIHEALHDMGATRLRIVERPIEAFECLRNIESDASSMGYDVPSEDVVAEAERILLGMYTYRQLPYDVYSMSDGRIAIGVDGGFGRSMLVVCEPRNTALCVVTNNRVSRRARYGDSGFLPDDFVKQGLRQLSAAPARTADKIQY